MRKSNDSPAVSIVNDLLSSSISHAGQGPSFSITRRTFLLGASAVILHPSKTKAETDHPELQFINGKNGFELTYRSSDEIPRIWTLKAHMFSGQSSLQVVPPLKNGVVVNETRIFFNGTHFHGVRKIVKINSTVKQVNGVWTILNKFHGENSPGTQMGLVDWLEGQKSSNYIVDPQVYQVAGKYRLSITGKNALLQWDKNLTAEFTDTGEIYYSDIGRSDRGRLPKLSAEEYGFIADKVKIKAREKASDALIRMEPKAKGQPSTALIFTGVKKLHLGKTNTGESLSLELVQPSITQPIDDALVSIETYQNGPNASGVLIVKGTGTLVVDAENGSPPTRIHLEAISLAGKVGDLANNLVFGAKLARKPFDIEPQSVNADLMPEGFGLNIGSLALKVSGTGEPVIVSFNNGQTGSLVLPAKLMRAHIPVEGASRADLRFNDANIDLVIGNRRNSKGSINFQSKKSFVDLKNSTSKENKNNRFGQTNCLAELTIGKSPHFQASLENAELHLARRTDLFDLHFRFQNYALKIEDGVSHLLPRWGFLACEPTSATPRRIAIFGPQHVQEEVFFHQKKSGEKPSSLSGDDDLTDNPIHLPDDRYIRPISAIKNDDLAKTRVALPTRLVFEETDEDASARRPTKITIEMITDWTELALVVHKRALPRNISLEEQLKVAEITKSTPRNKARSNILRSLTPPEPWETAMEPVTGLIMSPDASGKFITPNSAPEDERVPIWSTRLSLPTNAAVRAIYARGLDDSFLQSLDPEDPFYLTYETSLSPKDRREIVAMTSLYGLAALRRLVVDQNNIGQSLFQDDPKGMVIRPDGKETYAYLSDAKKDYSAYTSNTTPGTALVYQEGIMIPKPFVDFNLTLSSYRSSLFLRWEGEPPAALSEDRFFRGDFNIESYVHKTRYGRDALVQVTYKGFLFPLGHRAAYIKLSERTMLPFGDNVDKLAPTAKLTQRRFIVVRKPKKYFPALNQPHASRAFPASEVEMITTITPDLRPPKNNIKLSEDGTVPDPSTLTGWNGRKEQGARIFWPRTGAGPGSEVEFEFRLDGDDTPARSKLIFVDNTAAHSPDLMKALVAKYNEGQELDGTPDANTVFHGAVNRRYAATSRIGETSFKTDTWFMKVEGRVKPKDADTYEMDALMEGKDQPPFYPTVETARIHMQSVDRMLGQPQGPITVKFNDDLYINHAFDSLRNPSEIYLEVVEPIIKLDFTNQGDSSGGIAKPNATLAAISRRIGLVGGTIVPSRPEPPSETILAPAKRSEFNIKFDFSSAKSGEFNPFEFLPDGKILGILEIRDLVQAVAILEAPQLKEVYEFGGKATLTIRDTLIKTTPLISRTITQSIIVADKTMGDFLSSDINTRDLYPDLIDQLLTVAGTCEEVLKDAKSVATSTMPKDVAQALGPSLTRLYSEGNTLVKTIDDVIKNPTPEIVGTTIEEFQRIKLTISKAIDIFNPKEVFVNFKDIAFRDICDQLIDDDIFELLFGPAAYEDNGRPEFVFPAPPPPGSANGNSEKRKKMLERACLEMLEYPEQITPNLQRSLFYEVYGQVTSQLMLELKKIDLGVEKLLLWSRRKLAEVLSGVLKRGFLEARIDAVHDTVWAIIALVGEELKSPIDLINPKTDLERRISRLMMKVEPILDTFIKNIKAAAISEKIAQDKRLQAILHMETEALNAKTEETKKKIEIEISKLEAKYAKYEPLVKAITLLAKELEEADPKILAQQVVATIKAELLERVEALEEELRTHAKRNRNDLIARALGTALSLLDQMTESAKAQAITTSLEAKKDEYCTTGEDTSSIYGFVVDVINFVPAAELHTSIATASKAMDTLKPPALISEEVRSQLEVQISAIRRSLNRFAGICQDFVRIQTFLKSVKDSKDKINICLDLKKYLEPVEQAYDMRRSASNALGDVFDDLDALWQTAHNIEANAEIKIILDEQVIPALIQALLNLSGVEKTADSAIELLPKTFVDAIAIEANNLALELNDDVNNAKNEAVKLKYAATVIRSQVKSRTKGELKRLTISASSFIAQKEKKLIARLLQGLVIGSKTVLKMSLATAIVVRDLTDLLTSLLYEPADTAIDGVLKTLEPKDGTPISQLLAVLAEPALADLKAAKNLVSNEKAAFDSIHEAVNSFIATQSISNAEAIIIQIENLKKLIDQADGALGLVRAVDIVSRMVQALGSGQLDKLFDFDNIKNQLLEAISELIPASVKQSYDWDTRVGPFPSSNPIFEIDRALEVGKLPEYGAIIPKTKKGITNDLVLEASIEINLFTGDRKIITKGRMRPFKIHLLGSAIDLATIGFKGMEVISVNGAKPTFKADIAEVEIGQALSFISALAPFFGPKPDNGPYVRLKVAPLGVEAGYKFSAPVIYVGAIVFSGIAIKVEMFLPFENQQATFSFVFASRTKPFLVSVPPYGGGGFVGLLATPKGVVGFEIQVEFGAVVPIEFGPLKADGRVTAGIYLKSRPGMRVIEGFVRAVGEGNIACFSIFVCLEVTIRQENGGNVTGSASFTFSFKVGFVEISYGFTASYAVQGGGGDSQEESERVEGFLARNDYPVIATYTSTLPDRRKQWASYKNKFENLVRED